MPIVSGYSRSYKRSRARFANTKGGSGVRKKRRYARVRGTPAVMWNSAMANESILDTDWNILTVPATVTTDATSQCINLVPQGAATGDRYGNKITMKSIDCRFTCGKATTTGGTFWTQQARVMLICDKQHNREGTLATSASFLGAVDDDWRAFKAKNYSERFVILRDERWTAGLISASNIPTKRSWHWHVGQRELINKGIHQVQYNSDAGTLAAISTCAFYLCCVCENSGVNDALDIFGVARVRFSP